MHGFVTMGKKLIEVGDVLYQLRHGTAQEKIVIETVSGQCAFARGTEYQFVRDQLEPIIRLSQGLGYRKQFGESFCFKTDENAQRMDTDIKLRYIRNYNYSKLTEEQLDTIITKIKEYEQ